MTMTLPEWDETIAPHLHAIEAGALMCSRHVGQLVYRPVFDTLAADELAKLEALLDIAIEKVRAARRTYQEKPVCDG